MHPTLLALACFLLPVIVWAALFVPRMRAESHRLADLRRASEARSHAMIERVRHLPP